MKAEHETWIAAAAMVPASPNITLHTQPALRFSQGLKEITPQIQATFRDQELVIENPNRVDLFNLKLDLNLPEVIMCGGDDFIPPGIDLRINAVDSPNQAMVLGNASATDGAKVPTPHWTLQTDRLGPRQRVVLGFYTAKPDMTMPYDWVRLNPDSKADNPEEMDDHKVCFFFLQGTYQFYLRGEYVTQNVFVPLFFKANTRMMTSRPVQTSSEPWTVPRTELSRGANLKAGSSSMNVVWMNIMQY